MRFGVLLLACLLSGCALSTPEPEARGAQTKTVHPSRPEEGRRQQKGAPPEVKLDEAVVGMVVAVNPTLRFLVMDFPVRRLPVLEQRLSVYRNGQKVGEVKV